MKSGLSKKKGHSQTPQTGLMIKVIEENRLEVDFDGVLVPGFIRKRAGRGCLSSQN